MTKKVLFLGAAQFQLPPIEYALSRGYEVITCDNVPGNPGHRLAHRSYNVSTRDKEAVLSVAQSEKVSGVLTFGSDISAPAVAYVGEKLGLSTPGRQAVATLTNKASFRHFLDRHKLQSLPYAVFSECNAGGCLDFVSGLGLPVIVKPVDSSGSKGVSVVDNLDQIPLAMESAFFESNLKTVIVEQFVRKSGFQICGDGFMLRGKLVFADFGDGHFHDDRQVKVPFAETFPGSHPEAILQNLWHKLELTLNTAGFHSGPFNLDVLIDESGSPFIIELGPRSGGNYIPTAISYKNNIDLIGATVELCLDSDYEFPAARVRKDRHVACYMLHSHEPGRLQNVTLSPDLKPYLVAFNPYLSKGDPVLPFTRASNAIGNLVLEFSTAREMSRIIDHMTGLCTVSLEGSYAAAL